MGAPPAAAAAGGSGGGANLTCSGMSVQSAASGAESCLRRKQRGHPPGCHAEFLWGWYTLLRDGRVGTARYLLISVTMMLVRTVLSIKLGNTGGTAMQHFVVRRWPALKRTLATFAGCSVLQACVSQALRCSNGSLSSVMRRNLAERIGEALEGDNLWRLTQLHGKGATQQAEVMVSRVCSNTVEFASDMSQTLLDLCYHTLAFGRLDGAMGPTCCWAYLVAATLIRKVVSARLQLPARLRELDAMERELADTHNRVAEHVDELFFLGGTSRLREHLQHLHHRIDTTTRRTRWFRGVHGLIDSVALRYLCSLMGYFLLYLPYMLEMDWVRNKSPDQMARDYIMGTQHLTIIVQACQHLCDGTGVQLRRIETDVGRVVEFSRPPRGTEEAGQARAAPAADAARPVLNIPPAQPPDAQGAGVWRQRCDSAHIRQLRAQLHERLNRGHAAAAAARSGSGSSTLVTEGDRIALERVDLTADGAVLAKGLSFQAGPGSRVLVAASGRAATALFRLLGGLTPPAGGRLVRPRREDLALLTADPFFFRGTLRQQIIFPHAQQDLASARLDVSDADLARLLSFADSRGHILSRYGLDTVADWGAELPLAQRQQLALARVCYHRPLFVALQEGCFSALPDDAEGVAYQVLRQLGIGWLTSASPSPGMQLLQQHDFVLHLDGRGSWQWDACGPPDGASSPGLSPIPGGGRQ